MANTKRSAEKESFWRWVIEEHQRSGLTVRAFCQREGISEPSFYGWRRELNKRDASPGRCSKAPVSTEGDANGSEGPRADEPVLARGDQPSLIPVDVVDLYSNGESPATIEVLTPSGFTLRVQQDIPPKRLDGLLKVLASCQIGEVGRKGATAC